VQTARPSHHCHASLNLDGGLEGLLALLDALLGLEAHDATAPLLAGILVLLDVALLDGGDELGELALVLGADLGDGEDSGGLVVLLEPVENEKCGAKCSPSCGRRCRVWPCP